jgi:hypothetical protein
MFRMQHVSGENTPWTGGASRPIMGFIEQIKSTARLYLPEIVARGDMDGRGGCKHGAESGKVWKGQLLHDPLHITGDKE